VAGSFEHDNEPSGSLKGGGGGSWLSERKLASQEILCSTELVSTNKLLQACEGDHSSLSSAEIGCVEPHLQFPNTSSLRAA